MRHPARMDRRGVRERLLNDPAVAGGSAPALRRCGALRSRDVVDRRGLHRRDRAILRRRRVHPAGYRAAGWLLDLFYKVTVDHETGETLPADAVAVYLINHRSNADYVLVSYALAGQVAHLVRGGRVGARVSARAHLQGVRLVLRAAPISRAALPRGARAIRAAHHARGRDAGDLPRGRPHARRHASSRPRSGSSTTSSASRAIRRIASRMYVVPVAVNYDRVLEDRSLLRELASPKGASAPSRLAQVGEVARYCAWNADAPRPCAGGSATDARR